ncbi:MAG: ATP-dependent helicase [Parcubacteria group bacterium]|nr:ATP-dependent helicase [Parcubacteria group bacterium]
METKNFEELYEKLNTKQREAVDAIDGPVVVLAGPGTGKTQILTLRIANILRRTDAAPDSILALTFTEAAASNMRKRLFEIIGAPAYRVRISTFHGFCNDLIQMCPDSFPRIIGAKNITEAEQFGIIKEVVLSLPLQILRPHGDELYYVHSILRALSDLKREGIDDVEFGVRVEKEEKGFLAIDDLYHSKGVHEGKMKSEYKTLEKSIEKNKELRCVYGEYERVLKDRRLYDYNDMIMEVVRMLKANPDFLLTLQERYQYILADEHQDVNDAQNTLLELLASYDVNPNIFIVGDDKQAIFRFQGASLQNFLYFLKKYPRARAIALEENYRSTQVILDASHGLAEGMGESVSGVSRELKAVTVSMGEKIRVRVFKTASDEHFFLAREIAGLIKEEVPPQEVAVLYRDNKDALSIVGSLEKMAVPVSLQSDQSVLGDPSIIGLITLCKAVYYFGEDEWLLKALHLPFLGIHPVRDCEGSQQASVSNGIHPFDIYRLVERASSSRSSLYTVVSSLSRDKALVLDSRDAILGFYTKLVHWKDLSAEHGAHVVFETIIRESGFLGYLLGRPDAAKRLNRVMALFGEIERLVGNHDSFMLSDCIAYLELMERHRIGLKSKGDDARIVGVQCMTAHKAKGLEFDYVYIVGVTDGHWGNRKSKEHFRLPLGVSGLDISDEEIKGNSDERRLFYVALTRARKEVVISYASQDENGTDVIPSQFVGEIKGEHVMEEDLQEKTFSLEDKASVFARRATTPESIYDKEFVRHLFEIRGVSATGLNRYLECPWKYFYADLLRVPQAKTKPLMYGIAAHGALYTLFEHLKNGDVISVDTFLERFKVLLEKEPLSNREYDDLSRKGEKALRGYYECYKEGWHTNVLNEFRVEGVELLSQQDELRVRLVGRIDKIELLGEGNRVNVVDYKTGKPKSRNQIEGLTRDGNGDYKRQLVFYKLLLDRFNSGKYHMVSGEIDFLEPNERGIYKKEKFIIDKNEVDVLEEQIMEMARDVQNVSFWDKKCDDKECEYCELRNMMKKS